MAQIILLSHVVCGLQGGIQRPNHSALCLAATTGCLLCVYMCFSIARSGACSRYRPPQTIARYSASTGWRCERVAARHSVYREIDIHTAAAECMYSSSSSNYLTHTTVSCRVGWELSAAALAFFARKLPLHASLGSWHQWMHFIWLKKRFFWKY